MKILITKERECREGQQISTFDTFFTPKVIAKLEELGEVRYTDKPLDGEELKSALKDIDIVIASWGTASYTKDILDSAPNLKMIAYTAGSIVPVLSKEDDELQRRGIKLLSGNRFFAESVAAGTICYMLTAQRRLIDKINEVKELGWRTRTGTTSGLRKKKIGLVGFGMIAKEVVRMLSVFDVDEILVSCEYQISEEDLKKYNVRQCEIEELFKTCDIISIHAGMTDENYHLVNKTLLESMKEDALIVNTARGPIINENELIDVLKTKKIRAILDVYEVEPLPKDSELRKLDNVILVPHLGGPTIDVREMIAFDFIEDIKRFINGEPLVNEMSYDYAKRMTDDTKFGKKI